MNTNRNQKPLLILLVILFIPIIINCALLIQQDCIPIVGNSINWLAFWGSYCGGIITACISYVILKIEIKSKYNLSEKELNYHYMMETRKDLANRLSIIESTSDILKNTIHIDKVDSSIEINRLNMLHNRYTEAGNTTKIIYGHSEKKQEVDIANKYGECVTFLTQRIDELTILLFYRSQKDEIFMSELETISNKCLEYNEYVGFLYDNIIEYCKELEQKYKNIKI